MLSIRSLPHDPPPALFSQFAHALGDVWKLMWANPKFVASAVFVRLICQITRLQALWTNTT